MVTAGVPVAVTVARNVRMVAPDVRAPDAATCIVTPVPPVMDVRLRTDTFRI